MENTKKITLSYVVDFNIFYLENEDIDEILEESSELIEEHLKCKGNLPENIKVNIIDYDIV